LTSGGEKKIQVIKEVRALTSLDSRKRRPRRQCPQARAREGLQADADKAKASLEAAGATVEVK